MKILAFTDTHNDPQGLAEIARKAKQENPDMLICCGDVSNFGSDLVSAGRKLNALAKKILIVPGNHETPEEVVLLCQKFKNFINLHEQFFEDGGFLFFGYGTGGFAMRDPYFEKKVATWKKKMAGKKIVFVTHAPIYNTKLDFLHNRHLGNKSTRTFIEDVQPALTLCGHFHENEKKKDKVKNALVINPGFDGMIVNI